MNESKPDATSQVGGKLKGRGRENIDLYAVNPKGSEYAKNKAKTYFDIMNDENSSYEERAKVVGITTEEYRQGEAFADMTNYVLTEAYGRLMDIKDITGRKNFYSEVLSGLDRLVGVDGLTQDQIKNLKRMWSEIVGDLATTSQLEMNAEQKAKLDERRREIEERKKKKAAGPVPTMPDSKPSAQ